MENTMSHDKIRAATRKRMAATGEPYAVARREVIKEHAAAKTKQFSLAPGMTEIMAGSLPDMAGLRAAEAELNRLAEATNLIPDMPGLAGLAPDMPGLASLAPDMAGLRAAAAELNRLAETTNLIPDMPEIMTTADSSEDDDSD
jgi:hypothetical protein